MSAKVNSFMKLETDFQHSRRLVGIVRFSSLLVNNFASTFSEPFATIMKRNHQPLARFCLLANWVSALCLLICSLLNPHLCLAQNSVAVAVEDQASPWSRPGGSGYRKRFSRRRIQRLLSVVDVDLKVCVPYARCKRMAINGEVRPVSSTSPSNEFDGLLELSERPLFCEFRLFLQCQQATNCKASGKSAAKNYCRHRHWL